MKKLPILCNVCRKGVDRSKPYFVILLHKEIMKDNEIGVLENGELKLFCSRSALREG